MPGLILEAVIIKKVLVWIATFFVLSSFAFAELTSVFSDNFDSGNAYDNGWISYGGAMTESGSEIFGPDAKVYQDLSGYLTTDFMSANWTAEYISRKTAGGSTDYSRWWFSPDGGVGAINAIYFIFDQGSSSRYMKLVCIGSCTCSGYSVDQGYDTLSHNMTIKFWENNNTVSGYMDGVLKYNQVIGGTCNFSNWNVSLHTRSSNAKINSFELFEDVYIAPAPIVNSTELHLTISNKYNGTLLRDFSVNITWKNGSTNTYTTTNSSVDLINISDEDMNVNLTFFDITNYFNKSLFNEHISVNTSNHITTSTFQAEVCFNATQKVSGTEILISNFLIGSNSTTNCLNINAGDYNVTTNKTGWIPQTQQISIAELSNTTITILNISSLNFTIFAIDSLTNESLKNYDLQISSTSIPAWSGENKLAVTNHSTHLINGTYNILIDVPGYALANNNVNITLTENKNYTFNLTKTNSVDISIYNEITGDLLNDSITVRWSSNVTTWENITNTGSLFVSNITAGTYELLFYATNYSTRSYTLTIGDRSTQNLNSYMISSLYSTIFTIKDIDTGDVLEDASITMYKQIGSVWSTVESKYSDISGKSQFYYDPIANYRFQLTKPNYEEYVFYLNPILFSTYSVYMTKESVLNYSADYADIATIYSPTTFLNDQNELFNFLITSPEGVLTDYGIELIYPGGKTTATGTNAIGSQLSAYVNITGASNFDVVTLNWNYSTSLGETKSYVVTFPISGNYTSGTWLSNKDEHFGLGLFERILIVTIVILFIVGIATIVGQPLPGIAIGLFMFSFFVFMGFVELWAVLPSMFMGILFLIWKSGGY